MINKQNSDEFILVRGINIPKFQIDQVEQQYGARLVRDNEHSLLYSLDRTLQVYRLNHNNKDPDAVVLTNWPGEFFKHMVMSINVLGMNIPGSYQKPAWFRFPKSFVGL